MPRYDYNCAACGWHGARLTTLAARDTLECENIVAGDTPGQRLVMQVHQPPEWEPRTEPCEMVETGLAFLQELPPEPAKRASGLGACGAVLIRVEISDVAPCRVDHRHQTKAILADGSKVPGHFGVEAKKNRGRY